MTTHDETYSMTSQNLQLVPAHTQVGFSVKHLMVASVKGRFTGVRCTLVYNEVEPSRSWVEAEIDAASIHTGISLRDKDLKSPRFLEVKKYPTITFRSTHIEMLSSDHGLIAGNLTIHGVTREVVLDTVITGRNKNPDGKEAVTFAARTEINRNDFGVYSKTASESHSFLIGDIINIELAVEGIK